MWAFGYFPTYTLGTRTAAPLFASAQEATPDLDEQIASGDFSQLLQWLRDNIHSHAGRYDADELVQKATGRALDTKPFLDYLQGVVREVYSS